jgi:hypothetical protein
MFAPKLKYTGVPSQIDLSIRISYNALMIPKPLDALTQFETLAERWLETGFVRLFRGRLHRADLVEQLARALEDGQTAGPDGTWLAPDDYQVFLHPDDLARLGSRSIQAEMEKRLANQLIEIAQRNGLTLTRRPHVRLCSTGSVPPRQVRVRARLTTTPSPTDPPLETQEIDTRPSQSHEPSPPAAALSLQMDDRQIVLTASTVNLGRNLDNDLVVDHPRVSRHHAQLRRRGGHWWLTDLDSANGTTVNGQPVGEAILHPGDRISLAGTEILFVSGAPPTE